MRFVLLVLSVLVMTSLACGQGPPADAPPTPTPQARPASRQACEIHLPTPQAIQAALALPETCGNETGSTWRIVKVKCKARGGRVQFVPQLSGREPTSILARPLECTETWDVGVLNGTPRVASFAAQTADCLGAACAIDFQLQNVRDAQSVSLGIVYEKE